MNPVDPPVSFVLLQVPRRAASAGERSLTSDKRKFSLTSKGLQSLKIRNDRRVGIEGGSEMCNDCNDFCRSMWISGLLIHV